MDRFSQRRQIHRGAFAEVFEATDPTSSETVALLLHRLDNYLGGRSQAFQQLEFLTNLAHPTILRVIGFSWTSSSDDLLELATEFHRSGTLETSLKNERNGQPPLLNATQKSKVIFGIVAGMTFLHAHGVIHGDLHPSNILLNHQFDPVIGGFHLSHYAGSKILGELGLQAPAFMVPEYPFDDDVWDFPVDVYTFAVTLYSIFAEPDTLEDGTTLNQRRAPGLVVKFMDKLRMGVRFVRKNEISNALWEVLESCWCSDPEARPTFQDLLVSFRGGKRYVLDGADIDAVLQYERRVDGCFGPPRRNQGGF
jgi:serine/threonine protein kinase